MGLDYKNVRNGTKGNDAFLPWSESLSHPPKNYSPEQPKAQFSEFQTLPRVLFIDMNAFYASVEQQLRPELRGRPVIVRLRDSNSVIAASYEAKVFGIKTGMPISEAQAACPEAAVIISRPRLYIEMHHKIVQRLRLHIEKVIPYSIDEMAAILDSQRTDPYSLIDLARRIKVDFRSSLGEFVRCSIGIGPNVFTAKVAADMQKPDGLTILDEHYPDRLQELRITDLPGIGTRRAARLERHGITSVTDLLSTPKADLRKAWGSIEGEQFYERLRGSMICDYTVSPSSGHKSVTSSRVLPEGYRDREGAISMALVLASKALMRLRAFGTIRKFN